MKAKKDLVLRHIGKEYIVVVPSQGTVDMTFVYYLNEVAAWLWKQLEKQDLTAEQMVDLLLQHYDVEREQAVEDVEKLVESLIKHGLVIE